MPKLGHGTYPLAACIQFYVKYWEERARGKLADQGHQERKDIETQLLRAKLDEATGHLINRADVAQVWSSCFLRLGKSLDGLPSLMGRRHNLSSETIRAMRVEIDEMRANFVRDSAEFIDVVDDVKTPRRGKR